MALLLDRRSHGQAPGVIAADLAARLAEAEAAQQHLVPEGSFDIAAYRRWFDEFAQVVAARSPTKHTMQVAPRAFPYAGGVVQTRIYTPRAYRSVIVFAHGGGWVIGSADTHDHICRWLAATTGSQVVSVDYGLAPEHPYPTAVEETAAVLRAVIAEHEGDERTLFVAGDSAGANVAAMALLRCGPACAEKLTAFLSIYGAYSPQMNLSSHKLYGDGRFGLSESQMRWFWNLYAPQLSSEAREQLSPIASDLSFFPPTLCVGAECDLLLDDTLAFYSSLTRVGVDVSLSLWPGMTHGSLHFVEIADSVTAAGASIVQYVEERRRAQAQGRTTVGATLARVLRVEPPGPLAATVMARSDEAASVGTLPLPPLESSFLTSRTRLHGSVTHRLATDIIGGTFAPRSLLPTEDVASASFGVSRSAYREAIRTLAAKGLVSATPKVGTRVAPRSSWRLLDADVLAWHFEANCTAQFVRSLFEMRKVVEPSAAALAAIRRDDAALERLNEALQTMTMSGPRDEGWHHAVQAFHEAILAASDNELIESMWPAIQITLQWSLALQTSQPLLRLVGDPVADHAKVFQRIAVQDAEGALQEMAFLIDAALADTMSAMGRMTRHDEAG